MIGSGVQSLFGFKESQAQVIKSAIDVLGDMNASAGQRDQAVAMIIAAETNSGSWLAASWRPLTMIIFLIIIVSFWFGYVPPNITGPMPPMISEMFDLIKIGMGGYIGGRTIEKIFSQVNIGKALNTLIEKKIL